MIIQHAVACVPLHVPLHVPPQVIINMPRFLQMPLQTLLKVLPARVQAKVAVLGENYPQVSRKTIRL